MRPGQMEPNELEVAILEWIAAKTPSLRPYLGHLHILSREYIGVDSYTNFKSDDSSADVSDQQISLDELIVMPNVPNGMGAILFCRGGGPSVSRHTHTEVICGMACLTAL